MPGLRVLQSLELIHSEQPTTQRLLDGDPLYALSKCGCLSNQCRGSQLRDPRVSRSFSRHSSPAFVDQSRATLPPLSSRRRDAHPLHYWEYWFAKPRNSSAAQHMSYGQSCQHIPISSAPRQPTKRNARLLHFRQTSFACIMQLNRWYTYSKLPRLGSQRRNTHPLYC